MKKRELTVCLFATFLFGWIGIVASAAAAGAETAIAGVGPETDAENVMSDAESETGTEVIVPELTIWLDSGSEVAVRNALYSYVTGSEIGSKEDFPEMTWHLVDKSYLAPEQFQGELLETLEAGTGPDLIFMDEANGISPEYLMENDYLLELDKVEEHVPDRYEYLPGVLEAGQKAESQYVLPVYIQCPAVFGIKEELEAAGIDTETGFLDLKEFLEALTEAARSTGKQIFEDRAAVDWLEECCMAGAGQQERKELEALLQEVRAYSGDKEGFFAPYESLAAGECLFSGSYLSNKSRAIQNIAFLQEEGEIVFLNIPSCEETVRALITWAAAVNANTRYPREAAALLWGFQRSFVCGALSSDDLPALGDRENWKEQLKLPADWTENSWKIVYGEEREASSLASDITSAFRQCVLMAVNDAVFQNGYPENVEMPEQEMKTVEEGETLETSKRLEKDVLTVVVAVAGMGTEHPIYRWLAGVAAEYPEEEVRVQVIPVNSDQKVVAVNAYKMHLANAGPDILLGGQSALETPFGSDLLGEWYTDLTPFLPEDKELPIAEILEQDRGLIWGESADGSKNYLFTVSENSFMKEEAVAFCIRALADEGYSQAVQAVGLIPTVG